MNDSTRIPNPSLNPHGSETCFSCRIDDHDNCEVGVNFLTEGIVKGIVCACRVRGHCQDKLKPKEAPLG